MDRINTIIIIFLAIIFSCSTALGQENFWTYLSKPDYDQVLREEYKVSASDFRLFSLDYDRVVDYLGQAGRSDEPINLLLPTPNGDYIEFNVTESTVLPPSVARKYPTIGAYRAVSNDGSARARLDHGDLGFHALLFTNEGMIFIEPIRQNEKTIYQVYRTEDAILDTEYLRCGFDDSIIDPMELEFTELSLDEAYGHSGNRSSDPVTLRTYKLALAAAGEYTQARGGTVQAALSHMVMTINAVNEVFIQDLAIKFEFIDRIEDIIYTDPSTDPYPSVQAGEVLNINTTVLNNVLGFNKYDVGHVFSQNCLSDGFDFGVAGVSQFQIACSQDKRGGGLSCHFGSDFGFISTTAHEFGHHFGAGHTFSNCPGAQSALAPGSAFEPGSGSTLMSYGNSCGGQNVGPRDYYFHIGSINQMVTFSRIGTGALCPDETITDNENPAINISSPTNTTIPISTPFELIGEGADNDPLTYSWEQYNLGPTSPVGNPSGNAPSFVSVPPSDSPTRLFPKLSTILASTTNREEVLPDYSRGLTFRLTARDNHPDAGGVTWEEISFNATENAGPFVVTYPHFPEDWVLNSEQLITWSVANTDDPNGVNCQEVDILMSIDGGQTFPYVLADNTPNDGEQEVLIPNITSSLVRVKIAASENIFFDISNYNNRIIEPTEPGYSINITPTSSQVCLPTLLELVITSNSFLGFDSLITLDIISDLPDGAIASFEADQMTPSMSTILSIDMMNVQQEGNFELIVQATANGGDTLTRSVYLELVSNDFSNFSTLQPADGTSGVTASPTFNWNTVTDANSYEFILGTSPSFLDDIVQSEVGLTSGIFQPSVILDENTLYYWKVRPVNECGNGPWSSTKAFHTVTLNCQQTTNNEEINIPFSGSPTVNSRINIQGNGEVADVNIPKLRGLHDFVGQVTAKVISPTGTEVTLFANECFNLSNFNLGFDDDASSDVPCPLITNQIHRPQQVLATFNGEPIAGEWIMRIEDDGPGGGGALQEWSLKVCSNTSASNPYLVTNDTLKLAPDEVAILSSDFLLTGDDENDAQELIYTLVTIPTQGEIMLLNNPLGAGDQFTQADLNNALIDYLNTSGTETTDFFEFTVIDGEGGWLGIARFEILIDGSINTSVFSPKLSSIIKIFPNPTQGQLYIQCETALTNAEIQILDTNGKMVRSVSISNLDNQYELNLFEVPAGIYFVRIFNDEVFASKKIIVQH